MAARVPPFTMRAAIFAVMVGLALRAARTTGRVLVSSWFRSPDENAAVGGRPNSLHLAGEAIDLVFSSRADSSRVQTIWNSIGLDAVDEGDHLHLELDGPLLR